MGQLLYGSDSPAIEVDDRTLQYIQVVTATKLRRHESFTLTWSTSTGSGRETLWMQPSIPLRFVFDHVEGEKLDRAILRELMEAATGSAGLVLEPGALERDETAHRPRLRPAA